MLRRRLAEILDKPNTKDLVEGLEAILLELVERYKPVSILITGSLAKSRFVRGLSDIDILVVTESSVEKHDRFLLRAVKDVNVEVTVYTLDEVVRSIERGNQFIVDAVEEGFEVYGELRQLVKKVGRP